MHVERTKCSLVHKHSTMCHDSVCWTVTVNHIPTDTSSNSHKHPSASRPKYVILRTPVSENRLHLFPDLFTLLYRDTNAYQTSSISAKKTFLTSLSTISWRSGMLRSALTKGILSTSSGNGLCLTLNRIPTSFLGVGRPSGTKTCCRRQTIWENNQSNNGYWY